MLDMTLAEASEYTRLKVADSEITTGDLRKHLGASLLGRECDYALWLGFRWVKQPAYSTRTARIFGRGHREEDIMLDALEASGHTVWRTDPNDNTKQIRARNLPPHIGGSLDAIMETDAVLHNTVGKYIAVECKSMQSKYFNAVVKYGVEAKQYEHYIQGSIYAHSFGFSHFLYYAKCKNDERIHLEYVKVYPAVVAYHVDRGAAIVVNNDPRSLLMSRGFKCAMCDYENICKNNKKAEIQNCRSCNMGHALPDGTWRCNANNTAIEDDLMRVGCANWTSII